MRRFVSSCAVVACAVFPSALAGQDTEWNRYTLEHLGGVFISIEANDVCEGAGVTASSFEASTSLKLIEGEVGVLTQMEMLENPAHPELAVALDCAGGSGGILAYTVSLRLRQAAQMLRDTQITLPEAVTWHTQKLGLTEAARAPETLEAALGETLGVFIEAWHAANAEEGNR